MKRISKVLSWALAATLGLLPWSSCGYKDQSTENGKLAIIQQANSFLTAGQCGQALEILLPLYTSQYVDDEVRMVYSSAHACLAGFSFPEVIAKLKGSGTIWSMLVSAMYSSGSDNHLTSYQNAATPLFQTTKVANSLNAADRIDDANVYMIFMQAGVLASVISQLGVANASTGQKTVAITGLGTALQRCAVQSSVAIIADSVAAVGGSGSLSSLNSTFSLLCAAGVCSNKDPAVCGAAEQANGAALIAAIDTQWI